MRPRSELAISIRTFEVTAEMVRARPDLAAARWTEA